MKIKTATVSHVYHKEEVNLISKDQIEFGLCLPLMDELNRQNAIEYKKEVDPQTGNVKKTTTIKFIIP